MGFRVLYGSTRECRIRNKKLEVKNGPTLDIDLDIETEFQCNNFTNKEAQFILLHEGKLIVGTSIDKAVVFDSDGTVLRIVGYNSFNPGIKIDIGYMRTNGEVSEAYITIKEPQRVYIKGSDYTYILNDSAELMKYLNITSGEVIECRVFPTLLSKSLVGGLHIIGRGGEEIDVDTGGYWENDPIMGKVQHLQFD